MFVLLSLLRTTTSDVYTSNNQALTISAEDYVNTYGIQLKSSKDYAFQLRPNITLTEATIAVTKKWVNSVCPQCQSTAQDTYHCMYYFYIYVKLETSYYLLLLWDMFLDFGSFEVFEEKFQMRPHYEVIIQPDHAKNINVIINKLSSQHYDARMVHRHWVDKSIAFSDSLAIYLENQVNDWNKLIESWNITISKYDEASYNNHIRQKQDLLVLYHEWKMMNHSMSQLYKRQYRQTSNLKITPCTPADYAFSDINWNNTIIFNELCTYLNSIQSANLYDTQFTILKNLKVTHNDVYLKVYNSYTSLTSKQNCRQLRSFRTVSKIDTEEWKSELVYLLGKLWKDVPNQTLPFWFLRTASYWEMIKMFYEYLIGCICEFFLIRLDNYAANQKRSLLHNLNLALEHFQNL